MEKRCVTIIHPMVAGERSVEFLFSDEVLDASVQLLFGKQLFSPEHDVDEWKGD